MVDHQQGYQDDVSDIPESPLRHPHIPARVLSSGSPLRRPDLGRSTLVQYGTMSQELVPQAGISVLKMLAFFKGMGGTETASALRNHFKGHDRVVLITDEQHQGIGPGTVIPANVPLYTFNLVGYRVGSMGANPNRVTIGGGLTDAAFRLIALLEAGRDGTWPWEKDDKDD